MKSDTMTYKPPLQLADYTRNVRACWAIRDADGVLLAEIYCDELAPIFAGAPELLAACKAWEFARKEGGISHADFFQAAWEKTQSAITKAEGKQP